MLYELATCCNGQVEVHLGVFRGTMGLVRAGLDFAVTAMEGIVWFVSGLDCLPPSDPMLLVFYFVRAVVFCILERSASEACISGLILLDFVYIRFR